MIDFSSPVVSGKAGAVAHGKGIKVRSTHGTSRPGLCRTTEMHCGGFSLGFGRGVLRISMIGKTHRTGKSGSYRLSFYEVGTTVDHQGLIYRSGWAAAALSEN